MIPYLQHPTQSPAQSWLSTGMLSFILTAQGSFTSESVQNLSSNCVLLKKFFILRQRARERQSRVSSTLSTDGAQCRTPSCIR